MKTKTPAAGPSAPAGSAPATPDLSDLPLPTTVATTSPRPLSSLVAAAEDADTDESLADGWVGLTETEKQEARDTMQYLGVGIRRARQILRAYGGGKYLRRGIGAALSLNYEFSSLEHAERFLLWAEKKYKNEDLPISDRVQIIKAIGPVMDNVRRLAESSLKISDRFDLARQPMKVAAPPPTPKVQVGVSIQNNFPPVANLPKRVQVDD